MTHPEKADGYFRQGNDPTDELFTLRDRTPPRQVRGGGGCLRRAGQGRQPGVTGGTGALLPQGKSDTLTGPGPAGAAPPLPRLVS